MKNFKTFLVNWSKTKLPEWRSKNKATEARSAEARIHYIFDLKTEAWKRFKKLLIDWYKNAV